jgi:hypothetical protein
MMFWFITMPAQDHFVVCRPFGNHEPLVNWYNAAISLMTKSGDLSPSGGTIIDIDGQCPHGR